MKKLLSLIRVSMTQNMSIFKISKKNQSKTSKLILPIIIALIFIFWMGTYAFELMDVLKETNNEYVVLTLFVLLASLITIIEGVYKSKELLFNRKR